MKVYVKVWTKKGNPALRLLPPETIDGYNGLMFRNTDGSVSCKVLKGLRVTEMFMHASEPNALVVYCEEVER